MGKFKYNDYLVVFLFKLLLYIVVVDICLGKVEESFD